MSAPAPEAPAAGGQAAAVGKASQRMNNCWSCSLISGGGVVISGAYVLHAARKGIALGGPISIGTVAQITFGAGLATWGFMILIDPIVKVQRKT